MKLDADIQIILTTDGTGKEAKHQALYRIIADTVTQANTAKANFSQALNACREYRAQLDALELKTTAQGREIERLTLELADADAGRAAHFRNPGV